MHSFLLNNRDELIERCKHKVAQRRRRAATHLQLANGIPLFLDQLTRTLGAEEANEAAESLRISGLSGGDSLALSEMGVTATAHGKDLLTLGYSVDQVVHDYGDLCQAITDLAFERDAPFATAAFRTLNAFGDLILIEVHDQCGGLPPGSADKMFTPFTQRSEDRSGLGLGLSIARQSIEADGGTLSVRDVPGTGCVFTISLPRHVAS